MDYFSYKDGKLHAENVSVHTIAKQYGTPCYIYSRATLERHWHAFNSAFGKNKHLICYSVKANSNIAILNLLAQLGSGFDIVSQGELERVLLAGGDPNKVVFSGVGKKISEMQRALEVGIHCFNIESAPELDRLNQVAKTMGKTANISIRVNPDIDAQTHPYISTGLKDNKFGIDINDAEALYQTAHQLSHINIIGIDCHIGSQLTTLDPFLNAIDRILLLAERLKKQGINIEHLDLGGGLGVCYQNETPPLPADYTKQLYKNPKIANYKIIIEPGRAITANAGILVTQIEYIKYSDYKNFAIVDAAMNDLIRPALYQAWQDIIPVQKRNVTSNDTFQEKIYDIVGPICETADFLGKDRSLVIAPDDLLAVRSSGAYGFTMSSNYNSRTKAAEVIVDDQQVHLIRQRESFDDLVKNEYLFLSEQNHYETH